MGATCSKAPALLDCKVLDTPDEQRFDAITRLLASVFKVPISVVGLIDQDRLWLKSIQGPPAPAGERLHSFCDASLRLPCPTMMVVPDTLADVRFQHNQFVSPGPGLGAAHWACRAVQERRPPCRRAGRSASSAGRGPPLHARQSLPPATLPREICPALLPVGLLTLQLPLPLLQVVNPPYVRFYAGAPLVSSEGCVLGSLAVMDIKPRTIPAEIANLMTNFAELVVRELEKDKASRPCSSATDVLTLRKLSAFDEAVLLCDVSAKGWPIRFVNSQWCKAAGTSEAASLRSGFWGLFHFACQADTAQLLYAYAAIEERKPFALSVAPGPAPTSSPTSPNAAAAAAASGAGAGASVVVLEFRPATADHVSLDCPHIGIPSFVHMGFHSLAPGEERVDLPEGLYFAVMKEQLPEPLQPPLADPAGPLAQPPAPGAAAQQAAVQAAGAGASPEVLSRVSPPPVPQLQLSVRAMPPVPRTSEPQTPLADHEAPVPKRVSLSSQPGAAGRYSWEGPSPRSPGRELQRSLSPPWSPRPFGQETPDELSDIVVGPLLGRGAHGSVYRGQWRDQKVAIKVWRRRGGECTMTWCAQFGQRQRVHRQQRDLSTTLRCCLLSPARQIVDYFLCDRGTLYDAVDRGWLRASPAADAPPNMRAILLTAQDIAAALAFLHSRSILHGDLAGSNVLLVAAPDDARGFRAKVSDFGVSRILSSMQCATTTLGTISHMPPEMLSEGLLSRATDVYSFGCLCWEMYAQRHAWGGRRVAQIVHAKTMLHQSLELPPHCPPGFRALVESCLDGDHTQRPSFDDILAVLQPLIEEVSPGFPA
ncbi:hypothetical protein ABPG75_011338 [Micractinium tetrahymenae]